MSYIEAGLKLRKVSIEIEPVNINDMIMYKWKASITIDTKSKKFESSGYYGQAIDAWNAAKKEAVEWIEALG